MNYIIIEAQTTEGTTAIAPPLVYNDRIEAEAVFFEKLAYARRSGLDAHSVILLDQEGQVIARKCFKK